MAAALLVSYDFGHMI